MNYYLVTIVKGHNGKAKKQATITFAFEAKTAMQAIEMAHEMPGVHHHDAGAILRVQCITKEEYLEYRKHSAYEKFYPFIAATAIV